ncbi:MAG: hypothetical protein V4543_11495 [Bacteroidota bacterium]
MESGLHVTPSKGKSTLIFKPDESVSGVFLENRQSTLKTLGNVMPFLEDGSNLDCYFLNASKTEYFRVQKHPGDSENAFGIFEVGVLPFMRTGIKPHESAIPAFETESGIHSGISEAKLFSKKGRSFKLNFEGNYSTYKYEIIEIPYNGKYKSSFLGKYNMPEYFAEYTFQNNKLVKFRFGFE